MKIESERFTFARLRCRQTIKIGDMRSAAKIFTKEFATREARLFSSFNRSSEIVI